MPAPLLPHLRSRVASIDVAESRGSVLVLPSTSAVLGFQFRGRVKAGEGMLAPAGVTGIQPSAREYTYVGGADAGSSAGSVLVRFTPEGAASLGVPAAELAGRSVPLDAILPRARVAEVTNRLCAADGARARVAVVERFLAELPYAGDPRVTRALALLDQARDDAGVAAVARAVGMSERQLERRFLARVGVTPKRFAVLRRFERAVALSATAPSLGHAAVDAGYYDQSHFIRDFRRFTGGSPRGVLGRP